MVIVNNIVINTLVQQRTALIMHFEKKLITEEVYKKQLEEINFKLKQQQDLFIKDAQKTIDEEIKEVRKQNLKKEVIKKVIEEKKIELPRLVLKPILITKPIKFHPKKEVGVPSLRSIIIKTLCGGIVKSHDDVIREVKKVLPNIDDKKILYFSKYTILSVKKGDLRYKEYKWEDERFLLTRSDIQCQK